MGRAIKKTYDEVYEFFKNRGLELLDKVYINCDTKMSCMDSEGYKYFIKYENLHGNQGVRRFHKSNPYSMENIKLYMILNRENVELVEGQEYKGVKDKLIFKCLIHNDEFPCTWDNFKNNSRGCPLCGIEKNSGESHYMKKPEVVAKRSGKNHHNWKGGISNISEHLRAYILPWKLDSFEKYNLKCDITSIISNKNVIHHLYPFSEITKETFETLQLPIFDEINKYTQEELKSIEELCLKLHRKYGLGVCLTREIHDELHKHYGGTRVVVNEKQYYDFKIIKQIMNEKDGVIYDKI